MRRPGILLMAFLLVQGLHAKAGAQENAGFYARAYGGLSTLTDTGVTIGSSRKDGKFGSGAIVGGAFGYSFDGPWRAEVEYTYRSSSLDRLASSPGAKGDYASTAIMVNGLYRFQGIGLFSPYVGAGIGVTREVDFDVNGGSAAGQYSSNGALAFQAIAGAEVPLGSKFSGFGEIRAFGIESRTLKGATGRLRADYKAIDLLLGVSRRF
jgi:opacity protein-like surface antigen